MLFWKHRVPTWLWNLQCRAAGSQARPVDSVVIPCTGEQYVEEGALAARFAARSLPSVKEIILATDQPAGAFLNLPAKAVVKTLPPRATIPREFEKIWQSRVVKIQAALLAQHESVLVMDSDMNLLRDFQVAVRPGAVLGSFRRGKMATKVRNHAVPELQGTRRPQRAWHLNSAFLIAHRQTWSRLSVEWLRLYLSIWNQIPTGQPPTDQLPLAIALDKLGLTTVDLGCWINWPVSKQIGGRPGRVPGEVIAAHGGFPLEEWQKYLANPATELRFHDSEYTRRERYKA